jgi:LysR family carnitine catabolism transcriptional activator
MEIRQIEYVVGVAEHGGFTRAAASLHVTQPALSEGVARLEAELGVLLFDRVGRRTLVSSAGQAFLEPARQVLRDLAVLRTSVGAVAGLEAGTLEIAALPTLAVDPLARLIGAFREAYPQIVVHVDQPEETFAVPTLIRTGRVEIGLAELPVTTPGLVTEPLLDQELVAVLPPSSKLSSRRRLRITDLAATALIMTPAGTSMRRAIDAAFTAADASPIVAVETDQREAIVPLVLANAGAGILPRPMAEAAAALGAVTVPLSPPLRRSVGLVWRRGPLSPAARAFLDIARAIRDAT